MAGALGLCALPILWGVSRNGLRTVLTWVSAGLNARRNHGEDLRITAAADPSIIQAALSQHIYLGVLIPCRWQCSVLHGLHLAAHMGVLLTLVLLLLDILSGATAASPDQSTPMITQVITVCVSIFVVVPVDLVLSRLMRHSKRQEISIREQSDDKPSTAVSQTNMLPKEIKEDEDGKASPTEQGADVRWSALDDALCAEAVRFANGELPQLGTDREEDLVGKAVALDIFMEDARTVEEVAWIQQDEIQLEEDSAEEVNPSASGGLLSALVVDSSVHPSSSGDSGADAVKQTPCNAALQSVLPRLRVAIIVAPYRFVLCVAQIVACMGSLVALFLLSLTLESRNRGGACNPSGSSTEAPLIVIAIVADFSVQWIVVALRHVYHLVITDDGADDAAGDEHATVDNLALGESEVESTLIQKWKLRVLKSLRALLTTKHYFDSHPEVGQQVLLVRQILD